jgi:hypothetical protein
MSVVRVFGTSDQCKLRKILALLVDDVRSLAFDPFSLQQDYLSASKVDVGRSGGGYSRPRRPRSDFQIARHVVVFQQNAVVPRLVANTQFCSVSSDCMAPRTGPCRGGPAIC